MRRVLGRAEQRKQCQGQLETLERLRGVKEQVQEEDDAFIAEVGDLKHDCFTIWCKTGKTVSGLSRLSWTLQAQVNFMTAGPKSSPCTSFIRCFWGIFH